MRSKRNKDFGTVLFCIFSVFLIFAVVEFFFYFGDGGGGGVAIPETDGRHVTLRVASRVGMRLPDAHLQDRLELITASSK